MKHCIATITKGDQSVRVMDVEGMTGYEFDAVGKESLPLAIDLALLQTREGIGVIDEMIRREEVRGLRVRG